MLGRQLRCLFFGTDEISLPSLIALHDQTSGVSSSGTTPLLSSLRVITPQSLEKRQAVRNYCDRKNIVYDCVPSASDLRKEWWRSRSPLFIGSQGADEKEWEADLAVVVSFGQRIPNALIEQLPFGCINMHPSLLPKYRGAAPMVWTLVNRDSETGVSVVKMTTGLFDSGPVLAQQRVQLPSPGPRYSELASQLSHLGGKLLVRTIDDMIHGRVQSTAQSESEATRAPKISFDDGRIVWAEWSAEEIEARYRAFEGHFTVHAYLGPKQLSFLQVGLALQPPPLHKDLLASELVPGTVMCLGDLLYIYCVGGRWMTTNKLIFNGARKPITARDFANGYLFPQKRTHLQFQ